MPATPAPAPAPTPTPEGEAQQPAVPPQREVQPEAQPQAQPEATSTCASVPRLEAELGQGAIVPDMDGATVPDVDVEGGVGAAGAAPTEEDLEVQGWRKALGLIIGVAVLERAAMFCCLSVEALSAYALLEKLGMDTALATTPAAVHMAGSVIASLPASLLMPRLGQRRTFILGSVLGAAGCVGNALALHLQSFAMLLGCTLLFGMSGAVAGYYRFAAADVTPKRLQPRAVSLTIGGAVVSGIVGPLFARLTENALDTRFAAVFLAAGALEVGCGVLISCTPLLKPPAPSRRTRDPPGAHKASDEQDIGTRRRRCCGGGGCDDVKELLRRGDFLVAMLSGITGYGFMIFVMTATPLAMRAQEHSFARVATVIQAHAIAMFAPGLFTGDLITCTSAHTVMLLGILCCATTIAIALCLDGLGSFIGALVFAGVGWNFLFTAGSTSVVALPIRPALRPMAQALNEALIWVFTVLGALMAGYVHSRGGWHAVHVAAIPAVGVLFLVLLAVCTMRKHGRGKPPGADAEDPALGAAEEDEALKGARP